MPMALDHHMRDGGQRLVEPDAQVGEAAGGFAARIEHGQPSQRGEVDPAHGASPDAAWRLAITSTGHAASRASAFETPPASTIEAGP